MKTSRTETSMMFSPNLTTEFSGKYRDAVFSDKMIKYADFGEFPNTDPIQKYDQNSLGYRSPEFTNNVDLVFAGCSFTYGIGIPENGIWGSIIAQKLNLSYNNVSISGASIPWIVRQLMAYFKEYGNPKTLLCLFPNPTRILFTSNLEILSSDDGYLEESTSDNYDKKSVYNTDLCRVSSIKDRSKYSKKPYKLEDVFNIDMAIQISMQNIRMLEQYCDSSGIKFLWSTWSEGLSTEIEKPGGLSELYDFSHYVKSENDLWRINRESKKEIDLDLFFKSLDIRNSCPHKHKCDCATSCHSELEVKYPDSFYSGTDTLSAKGRPMNLRHFGVHRHIHFAESFLERIL